MSQPTPSAVTLGEGLAVLIARPGPLEDSPAFDRGAGGAEANVATVLTQLGVPTSWISRVGDDGFGRYLVGHLARRGVDTAGVIVDPIRPTGLYVKERGSGSDGPHDLAAGASRMLYYRTDSAASALSPADLDASTRLLEKSALIHTSGITTALSPSATALVDALLALPRRDRLISFDLNFRPALWARRTELSDDSTIGDILARHIQGSDVAFLGADEAEAVFGVGEAGALRAMFPQPSHLVIKNDKHSVTGFLRDPRHGDRRLEVAALRLEVTERIGAGDAFAGGYLAALLQGRSHEQLLRFGHLCAAAALTGTGDIAELPSLPVLESLSAATAEEWAGLRYGAHRPVSENVAS
ncbi:sugar kinase [Nocardia jejuensis]|uniref:sugar kinase n=1 Tax=Nocardia jejuensis TaxID=328049 RepID=UPI000832338F|nr:sugar kinase [Nocardia jejuensis]